MSASSQPSNIFLRMHPLQRILLGVAMGGITLFFVRNEGLTFMLNVAVLWDVFALSFVITSWTVIFTRPVHGIVQMANKEDGSRLFVLVSVIVCSFASMFAVLVLMISKQHSGNRENLAIIIAITGMMSTWIMVHTIFVFHYAHLYYSRSKNEKSKNEALEFPEETNPDYLDFAYFAFVIGMTFQVSDVTINSRRIRRTVLAHSLLAFALNTFVVALTINIIAGLRK